MREAYSLEQPTTFTYLTTQIYKICSATIVVLFIYILCSAAFAEETCDTVVEKIVQNRIKIHSGYATIDFTRMELKGDIKDNSSYKMKIWFTKDSYRCDLTQFGSTAAFSDIGFNKIQCWNCERPDHYLFALHSPFSAELSKIDDRTKFLKTMNVDLRVFGTDATNYPNFGSKFNDVGLEIKNRLLTNNYHNYTLEKDQLRDNVYLIKSVLRTVSAKKTVSVDAGKNYFINSILVESNRDSTSYETRLSFDNVYEALSGVWYAKDIVFTRSVNNVVVFSEVSSLSDVHLNDPVPSTVFTIAGIGLSDGTLIRTPTDVGGVSRIKDGKILSGPVYRQQVESKDPPPPFETAPEPIPIPIPVPNAATSQRWPYALGCGVFAIMLVFFLRRLIISRTG